MEQFRIYLQQEFLRRTAKNNAYSLRAFARHLSMNHATLSGLLSGKRKISQQTVMKLGRSLGLSPAELAKWVASSEDDLNTNYQPLTEDVFAMISDWHFDAILELSLIDDFEMNAKNIARALDLPLLKAKLALETLKRLELLHADGSGGLKLKYRDTTNDLKPEFTSVAKRRYQQSVVEKSMEALEKFDRSKRDHTSTTMAIDIKDLSRVRNLIRRFRQDLNAFTQKAKPNQVYQLQVSFFPLTDLKEKE